MHKIIYHMPEEYIHEATLLEICSLAHTDSKKFELNLKNIHIHKNLQPHIGRILELNFIAEPKKVFTICNFRLIFDGTHGYIIFD